ncbi:hypothetical protein ACR0ST_04325 [Aliidiomarina sp. Khilg15.8]
MRQWFYALGLLIEEWLRQRVKRQRKARHEAVERDPRAEWERRFGSMRKPTESELEQLRDQQASDRDDRPGQRDLD